MKMSPLARKLVIEVLISLLLLFFSLWIVKRSTKNDAFAFWEAEMQANNKRLFGDAWKDV